MVPEMEKNCLVSSTSFKMQVSEGVPTDTAKILQVLLGIPLPQTLNHVVEALSTFTAVQEWGYDHSLVKLTPWRITKAASNKAAAALLKGSSGDCRTSQLQWAPLHS